MSARAPAPSEAVQRPLALLLAAIAGCGGSSSSSRGGPDHDAATHQDSAHGDVGAGDSGRAEAESGTIPLPRGACGFETLSPECDYCLDHGCCAQSQACAKDPAC